MYMRAGGLFGKSLWMKRKEHGAVPCALMLPGAYSIIENYMKVLGIDIGTTSISFAVLEKESRSLVKTVTVGNDSFIQTKNSWEKIQDAAVIERKVLDTVQKLLSEYEDFASIGLTGQMHGILYVDREGRCVSPLYTWQDGRGNQPVSDGESLADKIHSETGEDTYTGYGWITHLYNQMMGIIPPDAVSFCTVADYIGMKLTGRKRPLIHTSMAASLGFFDLEGGRFKDEILKQLKADTAMAPEVTETVASLGEFHGILVYTAIGDNQASVFGAAGELPGTILVNMGTGGQISVISRRNIRIPGIETRPFLNGKYLLAGASLCGGRAYAVLENFFRQYMIAAGMDDCRQYGVMERILDEAHISEPLNVRTTFQGTRMDPGTRGCIEGIGEGNFTPAALIDGVLNGMAQELYDMYCRIPAQTETEGAALVASGNGIRKNRYLQKAFEKIFGKKLILSPYEEEAACGAALSCL